MEQLNTRKILATALGGLLRIGQLEKIEVRPAFINGTSFIRATLLLNSQDGYGGSASISLDMLLPTGELELTGSLHSLNVTLANLTSSLSTNLNTALLAMTESQVNQSDSLLNSKESTGTTKSSVSGETTIPLLETGEGEEIASPKESGLHWTDPPIDAKVRPLSANSITL